LCPVSSSGTDNGNLKSATYKKRRPGILLVSELHAIIRVRQGEPADLGERYRRIVEGYDPDGNMWVTSNSGVPLAGNTPTSNVYTTANQIAGTPYDAAVSTGQVNGNGVVYDAESRVIEVMTCFQATTS
jgi:hypothetical protein